MRDYQFPEEVIPSVWAYIINLKFKVMKTLRCRDAGFDCEKEIYGSNEEEVLSQAAEHALTAHQVKVTSELARQIRTLIRDTTNEKNAEL
jgi:predicted small metal-binding protein